MSATAIADVRTITLPAHSRADGELVVMQGTKDVPFAIARLFTVRAPAGSVRGRHAHKQCAQFLVCTHGAVSVECDDGAAKKTFELDNGRVGLYVPPGIWSTETYKHENSVLAVLCDRPYEEDDYLRDHAEFLAWRARR
jgi:dTDP-4-dehydrorhamnose 3,5-epimerase-like enzyme